MPEAPQRVAHGSCFLALIYKARNQIQDMKSEQQILEKLTKIEKEVEVIREHMVDADSIMTEDDYHALLAYRKEKESGALTPHAQMKKELGA